MKTSMYHDPLQRGYYIAVIRDKDRSKGFCWKIQRRGKPLGVKLSECGFGSFQAAHAAGTLALEELIEQIKAEEASSL